MHFLDFGSLVLRPDFSEVFIKSDLVRDPFGRRFVITGKHHAENIERLQSINCLGHSVLYYVPIAFSGQLVDRNDQQDDHHD